MTNSGYFKDTDIYKLTMRMIIFTGLMIAICRLTRGYIMPLYTLVGVIFAFANQLGWSLIFFVLMPFFVVLNPALVGNESSFYGMSVRLGPLLIGLVLALRGASRQGRHRLPFIGIVPFLMAAVVSSANGWAPSVSYMKLANFVIFLFGIWFGTQNLQYRPKDILLLRSFFLSLVFILVVGSMVTIAIPSVGYATSLQHALNQGGAVLANEVFQQMQADSMRTLFCGITNQAQALAPLLALSVGWTLCDMLLLERRFRWGHLALIFFALPLLYLTRSRVGLLSITTALVVSCFYAARKVALPEFVRIRLRHGVLLGGGGLLVIVLIVQLTGGAMSQWIRKTSDVDADRRTLREALTESRQGLMEYSLYEFRRSPLFGSGFQVSESTQELVRKNKGLIISAPVEKGIAPVMVLGETGIVGEACFMFFLISLYATCIRRKYVVTISLFTVFLVTNMGEATFFSPGGIGGILWMFSAVGGFAIDTYLLYQKQVERQWAEMGFVMVAPALEEKLVEDRSGRKRVVEDQREVRRYGVKG